MDNKGLITKHHELMSLSTILEECSFLRQNVLATEAGEFLKNEVLKRATARSLQVIGDSAKKISKTIKENHPEIRWKSLSGIKDRLVHDYYKINYLAIWRKTGKWIPKWESQIEKILLIEQQNTGQ